MRSCASRLWELMFLRASLSLLNHGSTWECMVFVTTFSRAVEIWTTSRSDLPQTKLLLLVVFFCFLVCGLVSIDYLFNEVVYCLLGSSTTLQEKHSLCHAEQHMNSSPTNSTRVPSISRARKTAGCGYSEETPTSKRSLVLMTFFPANEAVTCFLSSHVTCFSPTSVGLRTHVPLRKTAPSDKSDEAKSARDFNKCSC